MINFEFLPGGNIIYHFWKTLYEIKLEKKYCCIKSNMELDVIDVKNYTYNNTNIITDTESKRYFYGLNEFWSAEFYTNPKFSDLVILKFEIKETSLSYPIIIYKTIYASQVYPPYLEEYKINCNPGSCDNFEYAYIPYITFGIPSTTTDYPITSYGLIVGSALYGTNGPVHVEGRCVLPNVKSLTYVIKGKKINNENVEYIFSVSFNNLCVGTSYEGCTMCEGTKQIKGCSPNDFGNIGYTANLNDSTCNDLVYNSYSCCWNESGAEPYYFYFDYEIDNMFINRIEDVYIILESLGNRITIDKNTKILLGFEGTSWDCENVCVVVSNNLLSNNLFPSRVALFRVKNIAGGLQPLIFQCCSCS